MFEAGQQEKGDRRRGLRRRPLLAGLGALLPLAGIGHALAQGRGRGGVPMPPPADVPPGRPVSAPMGGHAADTGHRDWQDFKRRFVLAEGRVVDTGNNGVSHTEGQGIGMLAAVHFDDRETFDALFAWTNAHLSRATDRLYSWRYKPGLPNPVDDPNNATDGDMLIAWALLEGARKWNEPAYKDAGAKIAEDIRVALVRPMGDRLVLLPGSFGFVHEDRTVLNPSYYVFPALHRFATDLPNPAWAQLWKDGVALLREARFGSFGLPADWIAMEDGKSTDPKIADGWPARFSWDAVRVPMYMAWVGLGAEPAVAGAVKFWESYPAQSVPAWTDLQSGSVAPYHQNGGLRAVQAFATAAHRGHADFGVPSSTTAGDYYAAALTMLAHVGRATRESYSAPVA